MESPLRLGQRVNAAVFPRSRKEVNGICGKLMDSWPRVPPTSSSSAPGSSAAPSRHELARRGASVRARRRTAGRHGRDAGVGRRARALHRSARRQSAARSRRPQPRSLRRVHRRACRPTAASRCRTAAPARSTSRCTKARLAALRDDRRVLAQPRRRGGDRRRRGARAEEPHLSDDVIGGLLIPRRTGSSRPAISTRALAAAARRHGAQLIEQRPRPSHHAGAAATSSSTPIAASLTGNAVVLAAGSWSGRIEIEGIAAPRAGAAGPRPAAARSRWSGTAAAPRDLERAAATWFRGTMGRCWWARRWRRPGFDERATVAGVRDLLEAACELVPHAWTAGFSRRARRPAAGDRRTICRSSARRACCRI